MNIRGCIISHAKEVKIPFSNDLIDGIDRPTIVGEWRTARDRRLSASLRL